MLPTQYQDTGDHTVVVDPVHRDAWIYDGSTRPAESQARGLAFDHDAFRRALQYESEDRIDRPDVYLPTTRQLDALPKFHVPEICPVGPRPGRLPVIAQQLYDGTLTNKGTGEIEHEQREAARRSGARLYDTSGYTR